MLKLAALLALVFAVAVSAYTVADTDKVCSMDSDCTTLMTTCQGSCGCSYEPVSVSALDANQAAFDTTCPAPPPTPCLSPCAAPPTFTCVKASSLDKNGTCGTGGDIVVAPVCEVRSACNGISNMCVPFDYPVMSCAPPNPDFVAIPTCQDNCLNKAQCATTPGTDPSKIQCSFQDSAVVPDDGITYEQCLAACNTPPPTTTPTSGNICKDGTAPVECFVNPCDGATCAADPNATCTANYCGGCNIIWTNTKGVIIDCKIPTPADTCVTKGCSAELQHLCIPSSVMIKCLPDPYVATCEDKCVPKATCATTPGTDPTTMLECSFQNTPKTPLDGITYDQCVANCKAVVDPCPGSEYIKCADPCANAKCLSNSNATCTPNYCGVCAAVWTEGEKVVTCNSGICADGTAPFKCLADPCKVKSCPAFPNATCTANYCGGCNAEFSLNGKPLSAEACIAKVPVPTPCFGLPCGECASKADCSFCSGPIAEYCAPKASDALSYCAAKTSGEVISASTFCPAPVDTTVPPPKTETVDTNDFIGDVVVGTKPVAEKFTLLITLVVKEIPTGDQTLELMKIFIDFIGASAPTQTDKDEVCVILKETAIKRDIKIPADKLTCSMVPVTANKRQTTSSYLAELSYPSYATASTQSSASAVSVAFASVVAAVVAL